MDLKSSLIYIGRVEDDDNAQQNELDKIEKDEKIETHVDGDTDNAVDAKKERVTIIGTMKSNEHFDDEPQSTNGVINTIIDATKNQKTNIYEVKKKSVLNIIKLKKYYLQIISLSLFRI